MNCYTIWARCESCNGIGHYPGHPEVTCGKCGGHGNQVAFDWFCRPDWSNAGDDESGDASRITPDPEGEAYEPPFTVEERRMMVETAIHRLALAERASLGMPAVFAQVYVGSFRKALYEAQRQLKCSTAGRWS